MLNKCDVEISRKDDKWFFYTKLELMVNNVQIAVFIFKYKMRQNCKK